MFKLDLFDFEKDEIIRTVERNFCPTILYIEFEKIREKVEEEKAKLAKYQQMMAQVEERLAQLK